MNKYVEFAKYVAENYERVITTKLLFKRVCHRTEGDEMLTLEQIYEIWLSKKKHIFTTKKS